MCNYCTASTSYIMTIRCISVSSNNIESFHYDNIIIDECLSARHWIAASVVCIYIYVCPSRFWNAIQLLCDVIAENVRTLGNLLPDFDHRYRYIIYALIGVLKKRWWSRKCRECILKTMMWGRFGNEDT